MLTIHIKVIKLKRHILDFEGGEKMTFYELFHIHQNKMPQAEELYLSNHHF